MHLICILGSASCGTPILDESAFLSEISSKHGKRVNVNPERKTTHTF